MMVMTGLTENRSDWSFGYENSASDMHFCLLMAINIYTFKMSEENQNFLIGKKSRLIRDYEFLKSYFLHHSNWHL